MILFKSSDFFFLISKVPETKNQFWKVPKKLFSYPSLHLTNIKDLLFKMVDL